MFNLPTAGYVLVSGCFLINNKVLSNRNRIKFNKSIAKYVKV